MKRLRSSQGKKNKKLRKLSIASVVTATVPHAPIVVAAPTTGSNKIK